MLQLGDWSHAQSPSLALLDLNDDQSRAYELTSAGMERYHGLRGVAFDIDESRKRIAVLCVDSADQLELALGTIALDQQLKRWSVDLKQSVVIGKLQGRISIDIDKPVAGIFFCDSGKFVVLSYDDRTVVVDFESGKLYPTELPARQFAAAKNSPNFVSNYDNYCAVRRILELDAENLKLNSNFFELDCSIDLKDPETGVVRNPRDWIMSLTISDDGNTIAVGTYGGVIGYKDSRDRLKGSVDVKTPIASVQFAKSGQRIIFGTRDQKVGQWDLESGNITWIDNCRDVISNPVLRLKLSSDEKRMYVTDYESRKIVLYRKEGDSYKRERVLRMERDDLRALRSEFFSRKAKKQ